MLTKDRAHELRESLQPLKEFAGKRLVHRSKWGAINFGQSSGDIEAVIGIATDLLSLPLEHLTEASAQELLNHIPSILQRLQEIDSFSIESVDHPGNIRDQLCDQLHASAEELQNTAYRFVPYLAYRHGDIAENREKVERIAKQAEQILIQTKQTALVEQAGGEGTAVNVTEISKRSADRAMRTGTDPSD